MKNLILNSPLACVASWLWRQRAILRFSAEMKSHTITKTLGMLALLGLPYTLNAQFSYWTENDHAVISGYNGPGGAVTIPETVFVSGTARQVPVTIIRANAFYGNANITSIAIPNSVTLIGDYAFAYCSSLVSVTFGLASRLDSIGKQAFYNCPNLSRITVPNAVTSIGESAFCWCSGVTNATVGTSVTTIAQWAFIGLTALSAITVDAGNPVFSSADGVLIKRSTATVVQCPAGKSGTCTLPSNINSIAESAFDNCDRLTAIAIPTGVTSIGDEAFRGCRELKSLMTPNSLTTIGTRAFYGCYGLANVVLGSGITSIGEYAFNTCSGLTSIAIPQSLTSIGLAAFGNCRWLTAINVDALNPVYASTDGILFDKQITTVIQCPGGRYGSYVIPNGVTTIASHAFYSCYGVLSVTVPATVSSIRDQAFMCPNLAAAYFQGDAPALENGQEFAWWGTERIVYYLPNTTGWGSTYGGCPTAAWRPDLTAENLMWNISGGASFQFSISNGTLPRATSAQLFWASGATVEAIIPDAPVIFTQNIPVGASGLSAVIPVPAALFESRPAGATHVLLVLDYENLVVESDESNNSKALAINLPVVVLVRGLQFAGATTAVGYWSEATAYLGKDFDVWVCNSISGRENVELAALELHSFIQSKVAYRSQSGLPPLQKLSIVAHSYGGLISRAYLLHRRAGQWSEDPGVSKVVMLSTPNCGSHGADIGVWGGWAPGLESEDALQCLTTAWVQSVFNRYCNDVFPTVPFYLFGATGGYGSGLFFTPWWLLYNWPAGTVNPNDGVVTAMSASGYRWVRSGGVLFQERQVGGAVRLTGDDHSGITSSQSTLSQVRNILLGGSFSGGAAFRQTKDGDETPPVVALVATTNGILHAGSTHEVPVPIDDCMQATFSLACDLGQVAFRLVKPDGSMVDSVTTNTAVHYTAATNSTGMNLSYAIDNPTVGLWTADYQGGTNLTNGVRWSLLVAEQSVLTIVPATEYFQIAGNVAVSAMLANGTQAMSGAFLSAAVQRPDGTTYLLPLYDDGAHGDEAASDGIYANAYGFSTNAGIYSVRYSATGTNSQGHAFARVEGGSFQIAPRTAWLSGAYSDQGVDLGPPAGLEEITVSVGLQVVAAGVYSVSAVLADTAGNQLASAAATSASLPVGATNLTLHFDTDGLRRGTNDGPYLLTSVVLWDNSSGLALRADFATNVYSTAPYLRTNFSDRLPPSAVSDLAATSVGSQSVILRWSAPDNEGKAASYSIRYRKGGLWPGVWDSATALATPPTPALPGTQQTLTVGGLDTGNTYYFGIKSMDQAGNESELSNVQVVRLLSAITSAKVLTNGQFQCSFAGEAGRSYVVQVSTNLTQWLPLSTNSIGFTNSSFIFTDSQAASFRQRFYRCVQGP